MDGEKEDQKQDTSSGNGTMLEQELDSGQYENISMNQSDSGVAGHTSPRLEQETDVDTGAPVNHEQEAVSEVSTIKSPTEEEYFSVPSEAEKGDPSYQSIDSEPFYSIPDKSVSFSEDRQGDGVYQELLDETDGPRRTSGDEEDGNLGEDGDESFEDVVTSKKTSDDIDDLMEGFQDDRSTGEDIFGDISSALQRLDKTYKFLVSKDPKPSDHHASRYDALRSPYTRPRTYLPLRKPMYTNIKPRETTYQSLLPQRDIHPYASYQSSNPTLSSRIAYSQEKDQYYPGKEEDLSEPPTPELVSKGFLLKVLYVIVKPV